MLEACSVELSTVDLGPREQPVAQPKRPLTKKERMAQERELLNAMAQEKAADECGAPPEQGMFAKWALVLADAQKGELATQESLHQLLAADGLPRELRSQLWLHLSTAAGKESAAGMSYEVVRGYLGELFKYRIPVMRTVCIYGPRDSRPPCWIAALCCAT